MPLIPTYIMKKLITFLFLIALLPSAFAHSPYGQWDTFRSRYLQIVTNKIDIEGDKFGEEIADTLRQGLPSSRALVSRAPDIERIASLLYTDQVKVAVISHKDLKVLLAIEDFKSMPISILLDNGTYVVLARNDLPAYHGYLISKTLFDNKWLRFRAPVNNQLGLVTHPGTIAMFKGEIPVYKETTQKDHHDH